jgi:hypothetical protein
LAVLDFCQISVTPLPLLLHFCKFLLELPNLKGRQHGGLLFALVQDFRNSSGSLAIFAAIRCAYAGSTLGAATKTGRGILAAREKASNSLTTGSGCSKKSPGV